MAFVTRCYFCGSVWLLPDKETAQAGPVRCSKCNHNFDASRDMLEVPDSLFQNRHSDTRSVPVPERAKQNFSELSKLMEGFSGRTDPSAKPTQHMPANAVTPSKTIETTVLNQRPGTEKMIPVQNAPHSVSVSVNPSDRPSTFRPSRESSGIGMVAAIVALVLLIVAALGIIFNQEVIAKFPQTKGFYSEVCQKIACPGFFLKNIKAFVVKKNNLIATGENGQYSLETTITNDSDMAQAIPCLEIQLVDNSGALLQKRLLTPREFLINAQSTKSVMPGKSLTVRMSIQTNVTPSRCVIVPVYP